MSSSSSFSSASSSSSFSSSSSSGEASFPVPKRIKLQNSSSENPTRKEVRFSSSFSSSSAPRGSSSRYSSSIYSSAVSNDGGELDLKFSKEHMENIRAHRRRMKMGFGASDEFDEERFDEKNFYLENENNEDHAAQNMDMGITMEPFNMRREMEEGEFDEEGHYILKQKRNLKKIFFESSKKNAKNIKNRTDEDDEEDEDLQDGWLAAVDQGDTFVSFKNDEERNKVIARKEESVKKEKVDICESMKRLVCFLQRNETPANALKRIKNEFSFSSSDKNNKNYYASSSATRGAEHTNAKDAEEIKEKEEKEEKEEERKEEKKEEKEEKKEKEQKEEEKEEKKAEKKEEKKRRVTGGGGRSVRNKISEEGKNKINEITELCNELLNQGKNVYFKTREELYDMATKLDEQKRKENPQENGDLMQQLAAMSNTHWEFRWLRSSEEASAVHGVYAAPQMLSWCEQGFISKENPIEAREVDITAEGEKEENKRSEWIVYEDLPFVIFCENAKKEKEKKEEERKEEEEEQAREKEEQEIKEEEEEREREASKNFSKDALVLNYLSL